MRNTPSTPENAFVRPSASAIDRCDFTALLGPRPALVSIADDGPDREPGCEQSASNNAANLAGDSGDGVDDLSPFVCQLTYTALLCRSALV